MVFLRLVAAMPAIEPLVQVLWGSRLFQIAVVEFLELLLASYKIPGKVPSRIQVVTYPFHLVV